MVIGFSRNPANRPSGKLLRASVSAVTDTTRTPSQETSPRIAAATIATAAGAILAMLVDTMIPEAFSETHDYAGLVTVLGFLAAFTLSMNS